MQIDLAKRVADWWLKNSGLGEHVDRETLETALLEVREDEQGEWILYNDYDPEDQMLDVIGHCGLECRGYFFSGCELGLPSKSGIQ